MSLIDHKGAAYAFRKWQQDVADEIARGERKGARILHKGPDLRKVVVGWMKRRVLLGHFRKRA